MKGAFRRDAHSTDETEKVRSQKTFKVVARSIAIKRAYQCRDNNKRQNDPKRRKGYDAYRKRTQRGENAKKLQFPLPFTSVFPSERIR